MIGKKYVLAIDPDDNAYWSRMSGKTVVVKEEISEVQVLVELEGGSPAFTTLKDDLIDV